MYLSNCSGRRFPDMAIVSIRKNSITNSGRTNSLFEAGYTAPLSVEYLVVAGGGGGGRRVGAGGGAGGFLESSFSVLTQNTAYTLTVGAGGNGAPAATAVEGSTGSNSVFHSVTANGGGGAGSNGGSVLSGLNGGCGGGSAAPFTVTLTVGGNGISGQGLDGGDVPTSTSGSVNGSSAGGGGKSQSGFDGGLNTGSGTYGDGGDGQTSLLTGFAYAGGGGGAGYNAGRAGTGGTGGGGNGSNTGTGDNGSSNTGGGGGGGSLVSTTNYGGGNGGSGVVVIKYPNNYTAIFSGGVTAYTTFSGGYRTSIVTAAGPSDTVTFA
jgi:hypothetical protein